MKGSARRSESKSSCGSVVSGKCATTMARRLCTLEGLEIAFIESIILPMN
ncbi:MAG: hypothetical protein IKZ86_00200 [Spirochaetaceae bacterium]|nr:hypothetical protein [Spirochaetaceae bacterium]